VVTPIQNINTENKVNIDLLNIMLGLLMASNVNIKIVKNGEKK
jgi:hypothetical protein